MGSKARVRAAAAALSLSLVTAFAASGAAGESRVVGSTGDDSISIGGDAPGFSLTTTSGAHFRFSPDGATRPMLLEVFATWCVHCARMAPVISKLYAHFGDRIDVIGASGSPFAMDAKSSESDADVAAWAKKVHASYPVAFDESGAVAHRYVAHGYPLIVIVDGDGIVRSVGSGEISYAALAQQIDRVLVSDKPDP